MTYQAQLYIDFSQARSNNAESVKLNAALIQAGWKFMNTRSFVIERDNLAEVFKGIELLAKQAASLGPISFCNFQIIAIPTPAGRTYTAAQSCPKAFKEISSKPFPRSETDSH